MSESEDRIPDKAPEPGKIGKQIQLPLSKAVEISLKSLRVRFWRSMLTVSSIILAIAFLTFVWTGSRVKSTVAIRMRPDVKKVNELARAVDVHWNVVEAELAKRFTESRQRRKYRNELKWLLAGRTGQFKKFCRDIEDTSKPDETSPEKRKKTRKVYLRELPLRDATETLELLVAGAREAGLEPDLEDWPQEALKLAGIKGVVQVEVDRLNELQLALQRLRVDSEQDDEELAAMPASTVWLIVISLLVCGVGITNAMLMSVTERFREIGTMKCLGALDGFIVKLFLLESVFQGVVGTLFGVATGLVVMTLSSLNAFGTATIHYFPTGPVMLVAFYGLLIGSALSVLAAVFPALRAARMAPVEAMRVEE